MIKRKAITLLEVIVVLAIIGILAALTVPAIQGVRESAMRTECFNNLKQITLASHQFASAHGERLPSADGDKSSANKCRSLFHAILPFLGHPNASQNNARVPEFQCPADPTLTPQTRLDISYAANAQAFLGTRNLARGFPDGTSSTIAFAEHHGANCQISCFDYQRASMLFAFGDRRATFADGSDYGDDYPKPGLIPSRTFQVRPTLCMPWMPQTGHRDGMPVALADGSVRQLSASISPATFWGAVSPAGREMLGPDW